MQLNDDSVSNIITGTSLAGTINTTDLLNLCFRDVTFYTSHVLSFSGAFTVIFGATTGSSLAVLRNASVKQYATSTAVNCGMFGVTFFSK
jgi:hypothetical protein